MCSSSDNQCHPLIEWPWLKKNDLVSLENSVAKTNLFSVFHLSCASSSSLPPLASLTHYPPHWGKSEDAKSIPEVSEMKQESAEETKTSVGEMQIRQIQVKTQARWHLAAPIGQDGRMQSVQKLVPVLIVNISTAST